MKTPIELLREIAGELLLFPDQEVPRPWSGDSFLPEKFTDQIIEVLARENVREIVANVYVGFSERLNG